jgi:hypothetical protein
MRFDPLALSQADRIVAAASTVLFVSLFLGWYSINLGGAIVTWNALTNEFMYIPLFASLGLTAFITLTAMGAPSLPRARSLPHNRVLLIVTGLDLALAAIGFIDKPAGPWGWSIGAFLGLAASLAAFAPMALPGFSGQRR